MYAVSKEQYEDYLNEVVKTKMGIPFGTYLKSTGAPVFYDMYNNMVQFSPSAKIYLWGKEVEEYFAKVSMTDRFHEFVSQYGRIDHYPEGSESVELITNIDKPSGIFNANMQYDDKFKVAQSLYELLDCHLYNMKEIVGRYHDKTCLLRIEPEVDIEWRGCKISVYTRFIFV